MRQIAIYAGILALGLFGFIAATATGQQYGDGHQCYAYQEEDCANGDWDHQGWYDVLCCCGSGGPGSAGQICTCRVNWYDNEIGEECYLTVCNEFNQGPCTKGPALGNVRRIAE